jgi:tagatose 6-phosphate kinase
MITTVTLNAAIDKTYFLPTFPLGEVTRIGEMTAFPGGKGINVARVVHQLGCPVVATGFVGGHNGAFITDELNKQEIQSDFVEADGESRLCLNIIHEESMISTELLEPGPTVAVNQIRALENKVREWAQRSDVVILSGSAPEGVPANIYATLIKICKQAGAKVFMDASGQLLTEGIRAVPHFIKPNETEVAALLDSAALEESKLVACVRAMIDRGISCTAVTLGDKGAIVGWHDQIYRVTVPRLRVVNTVGCGDAFVAGMAVGMFKRHTAKECIRLAAASSCANALSREAGTVQAEDLQRLLPQVQIELI